MTIDKSKFLSKAEFLVGLDNLNFKFSMMEKDSLWEQITMRSVNDQAHVRDFIAALEYYYEK